MRRLSKHNPSNGRHSTPVGTMKTMVLVLTNRVLLPVALYEKFRTNITLMLPFMRAWACHSPRWTDTSGPSVTCLSFWTSIRSRRCCSIWLALNWRTVLAA